MPESCVRVGEMCKFKIDLDLGVFRWFLRSGGLDGLKEWLIKDWGGADLWMPTVMGNHVGATLDCGTGKWALVCQETCGQGKAAEGVRPNLEAWLVLNSGIKEVEIMPLSMVNEVEALSSENPSNWVISRMRRFNKFMKVNITNMRRRRCIYLW
jgi:hypothetical protein